jgi:F-type H+-transporting ATPase subunit b
MGLLASSSSNFGESYWEEVAAFVIFIWLIYRYAWPPLRRLMDRREAFLNDQLSAGEQARQQAQSLVEERRAALEAARSESASLLENARAGADRLRADGERRAAEEHDRLVAKAAIDIELERERLKEEVVSELSALVVEGATRVVEAELDQHRQHRLIDEAIAAAENEVA